MWTFFLFFQLHIYVFFVFVQSLSYVQLSATPWTAGHQPSQSFTISQSLLKLMSIELVMLFNHLILCHPLLLLPSVFPTIRVFSNKSILCIMWLRYWSFNFSVCPSNEYSGLISFTIDWFDLLAVQGTLKTLLQHQSSDASIYVYMSAKDIISTTFWLPWWLNAYRIHLQCRRHRRCGFDPWVRKVPWRRKWQPHSSIFAWEIPWAE